MDNPAFLEERTRVIFNLPIEDENEESAVNDIISYLQLQRISRVKLRGFTHIARLIVHMGVFKKKFGLCPLQFSVI